MQITLQYETQLKRAVGAAAVTMDVVDGAHVDDVIRTAAEQHGDPVRAMLLDDAGNVRSSLLIFIGDEQWSRDDRHTLADGDTLTLMSPISGG